MYTLWPWKVPIQSPLAPFLSIGSPSLLALVKKYPSGVTGLQVAQMLLELMQRTVACQMLRLMSHPLTSTNSRRAASMTCWSARGMRQIIVRSEGLPRVKRDSDKPSMPAPTDAWKSHL